MGSALVSVPLAWLFSQLEYAGVMVDVKLA